MRSHERLFILWGIADEPDLAGLEALGGQLEAGHEPDRGGQARRAGARLDEGRDDVEVERARVHLADVGEGGVEAEVGGDRGLEGGDLLGASRAGRACPAGCRPGP